MVFVTPRSLANVTPPVGFNPAMKRPDVAVVEMTTGAKAAEPA